MRPRLPAAAIACAIVGAPQLAAANPRALPFTYTTDTLAPGGVELEQLADLTPVRGLDPNGSPIWYLGTQFQTEIEIGLAERLELGLYVTYAPLPNPSLVSTQNKTVVMPEGNGLKQRLRYILAAPGEWPIDVGVYGELTENDKELEVEAKILLQRRFGALRVAANLWAEYELEFGHGRDVVIDPTLGATYEVTPSIHVGVDGWLRAEYPSPAPAVRSFGLGPVVYAGPTVMIDLGKLWWTIGATARVTDVGRTTEAGEPYGPIWVRSMIGYSL